MSASEAEAFKTLSKDRDFRRIVEFAYEDQLEIAGIFDVLEVSNLDETFLPKADLDPIRRRADELEKSRSKGDILAKKAAKHVILRTNLAQAVDPRLLERVSQDDLNAAIYLETREDIRRKRDDKISRLNSMGQEGAMSTHGGGRSLEKMRAQSLVEDARIERELPRAEKRRRIGRLVTQLLSSRRRSFEPRQVGVIMESSLTASNIPEYTSRVIGSSQSILEFVEMMNVVYDPDPQMAQRFIEKAPSGFEVAALQSLRMYLKPGLRVKTFGPEDDLSMEVPKQGLGYGALDKDAGERVLVKEVAPETLKKLIDAGARGELDYFVTPIDGVVVEVSEGEKAWVEDVEPDELKKLIDDGKVTLHQSDNWEGDYIIVPPGGLKLKFQKGDKVLVKRVSTSELQRLKDEKGVDIQSGAVVRNTDNNGDGDYFEAPAGGFKRKGGFFSGAELVRLAEVPPEEYEKIWDKDYREVPFGVVEAMDYWYGNRGHIERDESGKFLYEARSEFEIEEKVFGTGDIVLVRELAHGQFLQLQEEMGVGLTIQHRRDQYFIAPNSMEMHNGALKLKRGDVVYKRNVNGGEFDRLVAGGKVYGLEKTEEFFITDREIRVDGRRFAKGDSLVLEDLPRLMIEQSNYGMIWVKPKLTIDPLVPQKGEDGAEAWMLMPMEKAMTDPASFNEADKFWMMWKHFISEAGVDWREIRSFDNASDIGTEVGIAVDNLAHPALQDPNLATEEKVRQMVIDNFMAHFLLSQLGFETLRMLGMDYLADTAIRGKVISALAQKSTAGEAYGWTFGQDQQDFLRFWVSLYPDALARSDKGLTIFAALEGKSRDVTRNVYPHDDGPLTHDGKPETITLGRARYLGSDFEAWDGGEKQELIQLEEKLNLLLLNDDGSYEKQMAELDKHHRDWVEKHHEKKERDDRFFEEIKRKEDELRDKKVKLYGAAMKAFGASDLEVNRFMELQGKRDNVELRKAEVRHGFDVWFTERMSFRRSVQDIELTNMLVKTGRLLAETTNYSPQQIERILTLASIDWRKQGQGMGAHQRDARTGKKVIRNRLQVFARLVGSSKEELAQTASVSLQDTIENLRQIKGLPQEMYQGIRGAEVYANDFSVKDSDLENDPVFMEKWIRYLLFNAQARSAGANLSTKTIQALDPESLNVGESEIFSPDEFLEGLVKNGVRGANEFIRDLSGRGHLMEGKMGMKFAEEATDALLGYVKAHADKGSETKDVALDAAIMQMKMGEMGMDYYFLRDELNQGEDLAQLIKLRPHDALLTKRRREVEEIMIKVLRMSGIPVQYSGGDLIPTTEGRGLIYEMQGRAVQRTLLGLNYPQFEPIDPHTQGDVVRPVDSYLSHRMQNYLKLGLAIGFRLMDEKIWKVGQFYQWCFQLLQHHQGIKTDYFGLGQNQTN